jgi:TolA-binding protein
LKRMSLFLVVILGMAGVGAWYASAAAQLPLRQNEESRMQREMEERMQKEANKRRQEEIRQDTQKLFQLATELKDAVDKTNENMLSLSVVKKAEEVEKLAKKVKEKMREGVGRPMMPEPPPMPHPRPGF